MLHHPDSGSLHIVILYVLIGLLAAALIASSIWIRPAEEGAWICGTVACGKALDVEAWQQQNCFETTLDDGNATTVCRITIDGTNQLLPLASINLTFLSQQCAQYVCTQEVNVRTANYTLNVTGGFQS